LQKMWREIVDAVDYGLFVERDPDRQQTYSPVEGFVCAQPWQQIFVMADGTVMACCVDEKREYVLGDATKQQLRNLWPGEKEKALRRTVPGVFS